MKLHLINNLIASYKAHLKSGQWNGKFKWQAVQQFQENWDMGLPNFKGMFDTAISNEFSSLYWANRPRRTKEMILKFAEVHPEQTRQMFHDLLYDRVGLNSRVEFFKLDCQSMLAPILHFLGNSFSRHFHEDYDAISIYLTFKYPNKYIFYNYKALIQFLKYTEAKHLPDASDLEKYHQLINTIGVILSRDVELVGILDPLLDDHCYLGPSHLLAHDFIEYNIEDR